jgi:hypothetical protein
MPKAASGEETLKTFIFLFSHSEMDKTRSASEKKLAVGYNKREQTGN